MQHLDDDTLTLAALGEPLPAAAGGHLTDCPRCSRELAALTRVVVAGRAAGPAALDRPAPRVWDAIARDLAAGSDAPEATGLAPAGPPADVPGTPTTSVPTPAAPAGPAPAGPGPAGPAAAHVAPADPGPADDVVSLDDHRRARRRGAWLAAAGFLLGVGATAGVSALLTDDGDEPPVVATAELDPLPGRDVVGTAALHEADGRRVLVVQVPDTTPSGFLAVWLLDEQAERLVNLGILDGAEGTFAIPPDIDLEEFPVVDVSDEPFDGDPGHGGDSIVRGRLA